MNYRIEDFGARSENGFVNTAAIQAAIDACAAEGGGSVVIPRGEFLCGGLLLKSHVGLYLEAGAVLKASANRDDYRNVPDAPKGFLLYAEDADDVSIDGMGTLLGIGQEDFGSWWGIPGPLDFRVSMLRFVSCTNVRILNITILYSDSWTVHLKKCVNVRIFGVRILNNIYHLNSDGIDPDSCRNVIISDCHIIAGDDCICAKTTTCDAPTENLVVTNCILETPTTAIKLGTESRSDFRDVHFSNCTIRNSSVGIGIFIKDGALAERVTFTNMTVECADREDVKPVIPLFIDIEKRAEDSLVGKVRDIIFQNIQILSGSGALLQGMPEAHLENITLADITFRVTHAADFSVRKKAVGGHRHTKDERDTKYIRKPAYIALAHIDGLTVRNVTVVQEGEAASLPMSALYLHDVASREISALRHDGSLIIED